VHRPSPDQNAPWPHFEISQQAAAQPSQRSRILERSCFLAAAIDSDAMTMFLSAQRRRRRRLAVVFLVLSALFGSVSAILGEADTAGGAWAGDNTVVADDSLHVRRALGDVNNENKDRQEKKARREVAKEEENARREEAKEDEKERREKATERGKHRRGIRRERQKEKKETRHELKIENVTTRQADRKEIRWADRQETPNTAGASDEGYEFGELGESSKKAKKSKSPKSKKAKKTKSPKGFSKKSKSKRLPCIPAGTLVFLCVYPISPSTGQSVLIVFCCETLQKRRSRRNPRNRRRARVRNRRKARVVRRARVPNRRKARPVRVVRRARLRKLVRRATMFARSTGKLELNARVL